MSHSKESRSDDTMVAVGLSPRRMRTRNTTCLDYVLLLIGAALILYAAAYFLGVRRVVARTGLCGWASTANATVFTPQPEYWGLPKALFRPIHELDRRLIRPKTWASWRVPLWDGSVNDPLNPKR